MMQVKNDDRWNVQAKDVLTKKEEETKNRNVLTLKIVVQTKLIDVLTPKIAEGKKYMVTIYDKQRLE